MIDLEASQQHLATVSFEPLALEIYWDEALSDQEALLPWLKNINRHFPQFLPAFLKAIQVHEIPQALGLQSQQLWEVDLTWVSNPTIHAINQTYRDKDSATDVLTFTLLADSPNKTQWLQLPDVQLGAIFVSIPWTIEAVQAAQQASVDWGNLESTLGLEQYVLERVAHGLLHLLGMHHDTEADYNKVVSIQRQVLNETFALS